MPAFDESPQDDSITPPTTEQMKEAVNTPEPRNVPMNEFQNLAEFRAMYDLSDIGLRYQHYSELLVLWEDTIGFMARRNFLGRDELIKKAALEMAVAWLRKTMVGMKGYSENVASIQDLVEMVPKKASLIYGGRGTPIRPWTPAGHEEMT
jgi:hypothetical protein